MLMDIPKAQQCVHLLNQEMFKLCFDGESGAVVRKLDSECRFGERVFDELEQKIHEFSPTVCIYLGQPFLPRLYLAKSSGAGLRIGFNCEAYYPFLNMSLTPDQLSEAELISGYYGVGK